MGMAGGHIYKGMRACAYRPTSRTCGLESWQAMEANLKLLTLEHNCE